MTTKADLMLELEHTKEQLKRATEKLAAHTRASGPPLVMEEAEIVRRAVRMLLFCDRWVEHMTCPDDGLPNYVDDEAHWHADAHYGPTENVFSALTYQEFHEALRSWCATKKPCKGLEWWARQRDLALARAGAELEATPDAEAELR
jgi:hypothetical protein